MMFFNHPNLASFSPRQLQNIILRLQVSKTLKIEFEAGNTPSLNHFWGIHVGEPPTKDDIKFLSQYMNDLISRRNNDVIKSKQVEIAKLEAEILTLLECNTVVHENGQFE